MLSVSGWSLMMSACAPEFGDSSSSEVDAKARASSSSAQVIQNWFDSGTVTIDVGAETLTDEGYWAVPVVLGETSFTLELRIDVDDPSTVQTLSFDPGRVDWVFRDPDTAATTPLDTGRVGAALTAPTAATLCGERRLMGTGEADADGETVALLTGWTAGRGPTFSPVPTDVATAACKFDFVWPWDNDYPFDQACPATKCTARLSILILSQEIAGTCGYGFLGFCECVLIDF